MLAMDTEHIAEIKPTRDARGRWLPGVTHKQTGAAPPITTVSAYDMLALREAKRHATVKQAANDAVERGDLRAKFADAAYIAALTETQMQIATTPEAPGATRAADWLMTHSGESEVKAVDAGAATVLGEVADVLRSIAAFARALPADVVDADAEEV